MGRKSIHDLLKESTKPKDVYPVCTAIDKACSEGITVTGGFSKLQIRKALQRLLDLSGSEFDRDKLFVEFFKLYSVIMAPAKRSEGVFHPSQLLSACPRSLVFDLLKIPLERVEPITGKLQRTFDVGTWYHIYIQNILLQIGMLEAAEVPVVDKEYMLDGHADGVFYPYVYSCKTVLEIKTTNSFQYNRLIFKPFEKHEFQASLYARKLECEKILFLYINKDTSEMKEFLVPQNLSMLEQADKKTEEIRKHFKAGTLPKRICDSVTCDTALNCAYAKYCFKHATD